MLFLYQQRHHQTHQLFTIYSLVAITRYHLQLLITLRSDTTQIRLFGDPVRWERDVPKLSIRFSVGIQVPEELLQVVPSHILVPSFVDGWAFGEAIGIGLHSLGGWWSVTKARIHDQDFTKVFQCGIALYISHNNPGGTRSSLVTRYPYRSFANPHNPSCCNTDRTIHKFYASYRNHGCEPGARANTIGGLVGDTTANVERFRLYPDSFYLFLR
jgi:hypothetical protein